VGRFTHLPSEAATRIVEFRMDPQLRGRVDAADVVQEAFIATTTRQAEFFGQSRD